MFSLSLSGFCFHFLDVVDRVLAYMDSKKEFSDEDALSKLKQKWALSDPKRP